MKFKRFAALLLAAVTLLTVPAFAAKSSFSDVRDSATAVDADVLRLMGVVNGSGNNAFSPDGTLTRAQFCAMAVRVMGREEDVESYVNRTIFKDVPSSHWARGYVNLAASTTVGETGRLIAGIGDGRFLPDDAITYAQAVTILLRMLGYNDTHAGAIWPQGYLNLAATLGFGEEKAAAVLQPVTRAKAAQLFVDMLGADTQAGGAYYATRGKATEDVFLFAVGGKDGAIRTSAGLYYPAVKDAVPTALEGTFGALVLDKEGKLLAFVPDRTVTLKEIVLSTDAQEGKLTDVTGQTYYVDSTVPVCNAVEGEKEREEYAKAYKTLMEDDAVTLALRGGRPAAILLDTRSETWEPDEALVVTGKASDAMFHTLTSGARNYTVLKDGAAVGFSAIKPYDVVTYDGDKNTLTVSDLRITAVLDEVKPSFAAPETVTAMGHDFPVLRCARKSLEEFRPGNVVTLLLTAGGKVAGFAADDLDSTAMGLASTDGVRVLLPNGGDIRLQGSVPARDHGDFVIVRESKTGLQTAKPISAGGEFDVDAMTLGEHPVAPNVRVYESAGSRTEEVKLVKLSGRVFAENKVLAAYTNTAGYVDLIVLADATGDLYTYGSLKKQVSGGAMAKNTLILTNADGETSYFCTKNFTHGTLGGIVTGAAQNNGSTIVSGIVSLKEVEGVRKSEFFTMGSDWYVTTGGKTYAVADKVEGYMGAADKWLERDVESIVRHAEGSITLHLDPISGIVRVIEI